MVAMRNSLSPVVENGLHVVEPSAVTTAALQRHARPKLRVELLQGLAERSARVEEDGVLFDELAEGVLDVVRGDTVSRASEGTDHGLLEVRGIGDEILAGHVAGVVARSQERGGDVLCVDLVVLEDLDQADVRVEAIGGGVGLLELSNAQLFAYRWCRQRRAVSSSQDFVRRRTGNLTRGSVDVHHQPPDFVGRESGVELVELGGSEVLRSEMRNAGEESLVHQ